MAIFFIASGYMWNDRHAESLKSCAKYIVSKIRTLWIPFSVCNIVFTLCNNLSAVDLWMGEMVIPGLRGQDFLPFLLTVPFLVSHWRRADQYVRDLQYLLAALSIACIPLSLGGILAGA